jgi:hypothetical protein
MFVEKASGAQRDRPELLAAMEYVRAGDILVVWKLDRFARLLKQLIETLELLESRSIGLHSLTKGIDTATAGGKLVFHVFGALAEFERSIIRERTKAGLDAARARGKKGGRLPCLSRQGPGSGQSDTVRSGDYDGRGGQTASCSPFYAVSTPAGRPWCAPRDLIMLTPVAYLEAKDASRNIHRVYGQDLFGDWVIETTYGRIGGKGRTILRSSITRTKRSNTCKNPSNAGNTPLSGSG